MGLRKKKTLLEQAEQYVGAAVDQAKDFVQDTARPALADAREKAAPVIADARDKASPVISEAKKKAAPMVAAGAATVAAKATDAKAFAETKAAELSGSKTPKKRSKIKTLLMLGAIGGIVAVVAKRLQAGSGDNGGWQSSYDPAPPPSPSASTTPPPVQSVPDAAPIDEAETGADPLTDPLPEESKNS